MAEARGFWKGNVLWWQIGDEEISDKELRAWVYQNVDGVMKYVDVVRKCHADAYANRSK